METTNTTQDAVKTVPPAPIEQGVWVPLRDIVVPEDSRPHSEEDIESRAVSMEREGQLENALLSREDGKLILVFGKGRYLSAQKRNWEKLRCDIREGMTQSQKLLAQLAENDEREEASPLYTAKLYKGIREAEKLDVDGLAEKLGKKKSMVYNFLLLADLPAEVQEISKRLEISLTHWLEIAKLSKPEEQVQLAQECAEKGYSSRELQARVKQLLNPGTVEPKAPKAVPQVYDWAGQEFQFAKKGKSITVKTELPDMDGLDCWMQNLKCSLVDFLAGKPGKEEAAQAA